MKRELLCSIPLHLFADYKDNASDKFLEVVEATDIAALLRQLPECRAIVTTGQKATDTLRQQFNVEEPKVGDLLGICV